MSLFGRRRDFFSSKSNKSQNSYFNTPIPLESQLPALRQTSPRDQGLSGIHRAPPSSSHARKAEESDGAFNMHTNHSKAECAVCGYFMVFTASELIESESLAHNLPGERVIEPIDCTHVMHEDCFHEFSKEFNQCAICSKPLNLKGGAKRQTPGMSERMSSINQVDSYSQKATRTRSDNYHTSSQVRPSNVKAIQGALNVMDAQELENPVDTRTLKLEIPRPRVTIRSEFPTITRRPDSQSITCLVTIEIPARRRLSDSLHVSSGFPEFRSQMSDEKQGNDARSVTQSTDKRSTQQLHIKSQQEAISYLKVPNVPPPNQTVILENLKNSVINWRGINIHQAGKLRMWDVLAVGMNGSSREFEVFLFEKLMLCLKQKSPSTWGRKKETFKYTLKGSIYLQHIQRVVDTSAGGELSLTMTLDTDDLESFSINFSAISQLQQWKSALLGQDQQEPDRDTLDPRNDNRRYSHFEDGDDCREFDDVGSIIGSETRTIFSKNSLFARNRASITPSAFTALTAPTYNAYGRYNTTGGPLFGEHHIPLDIVVVASAATSMQGLKMSLLKDTLRFITHNMGDRDRIAIVLFGSENGAEIQTGFMRKSWAQWEKAVDKIRAGSKNVKNASDVVDGINQALDLLMQRKAKNPLANILLISDCPTTTDPTGEEGKDFILNRAELVKSAIYSFGYGMTHVPRLLADLASETGGSYTYVKDWYMLRESVAGCLGGLQHLSHQRLKVKLRTPEGSHAHFAKVSGAHRCLVRANGREAEAEIGDLRFGDKKDILVQLIVETDMKRVDKSAMHDDPWEAIRSGLEAVGEVGYELDTGDLIEEAPIFSVNLSWTDPVKDKFVHRLPQPQLLVLSMVPAEPAPESNELDTIFSNGIPPHSAIMQRRVELLASDMLARAIGLVDRQKYGPAQRLLNETRSILQGMARGSLLNPSVHRQGSSPPSDLSGGNAGHVFPVPPTNVPLSWDSEIFASLDDDLSLACESIKQPAHFKRDGLKQAIQQMQVILCQRAWTFRTPTEAMWANRVESIRILVESAREWCFEGDSLNEESETIYLGLFMCCNYDDTELVVSGGFGIDLHVMRPSGITSPKVFATPGYIPEGFTRLKQLPRPRYSRHAQAARLFSLLGAGGTICCDSRSEEQLFELSEKEWEELNLDIPPDANILQRIAHTIRLYLSRWLIEPIATTFRFIHLVFLFGPVLATLPLAWGSLWWYKFFVCQLERAGPSFIKVLLGQWAASRTDIFPEELCELMSGLHSNAKAHPLWATKRIIRKAFGGKEFYEIFEEFDEKLLGVGAIAQVYRAKLKPDLVAVRQSSKSKRLKMLTGPVSSPLDEQASPWVAIKVLHPRVEKLIHRDLRIMKFFANLINAVPTLEWLSLPDEVDKFGEMMRLQLDLRIEAHNLGTFQNNFKDRKTATFPTPYADYTTRQVLFEEFSHGLPLSHFLENGCGTFDKAMADMGLDAFLHMLLIDNFIHADLHPGNIMVSFYRKKNPISFTSRGNDSAMDAYEATSQAIKRLQPHKRNPLEWNIELQRLEQDGFHPRLIFIDTGLVTELNDVNRANFLDLFKAICEFDGYRAGKLMCERCRQPDAVIDKHIFALKMQNLILSVKSRTFTLGKIKISDVLNEILRMVRSHHVRMEGDFINVVISCLLLEGIGRQLDPNMDLFQSALPILREVGTTSGSKLLRSNALEARSYITAIVEEDVDKMIQLDRVSPNI
ncbi:ABC1 family protein, mitochondrial [Neolecta irregularis DAH-3]|uniref:ABC1 family protein, mitochondrial n=1 Tax=Neolecta irregularis (strain DAH-3) TaxID=1198029 RepID=A0A1U7LPP7_NEOID|nr:ABC1 family protein, mitochondrial [Neolecta irregularis DAH-3]|eukprot:OLL24650.1 ABC1 family protein, mitochondrial [Neolecta irregularis DAH-3]